MEKELECPICLEILSEPLMFDCGHNFCTGCVHEYAKRKEYVNCPICKQLTRGFKKNIALRNVIDCIRNTSNTEAPPNKEEKEITIELDIPRKFFALIVGPRASTIKQLSTRTSTKIFVPRKGEEGKVKVTGMPEKVKLAKSEINELINPKPKISMDIPKQLHPKIIPMLKQIQDASHARIKLPKKEAQSTTVKIYGDNDNCTLAKILLEDVIKEFSVQPVKRKSTSAAVIPPTSLAPSSPVITHQSSPPIRSLNPSSPQPLSRPTSVASYYDLPAARPIQAVPSPPLSRPTSMPSYYYDTPAARPIQTVPSPPPSRPMADSLLSPSIPQPSGLQFVPTRVPNAPIPRPPTKELPPAPTISRPQSFHGLYSVPASHKEKKTDCIIM